MGMPMELNTMIVTKGREERQGENTFVLTKEGYRLYPIDIPIEVKRTIQGELCGMGKIQKLEWEEDRTTIQYQLISLHSSN